MEGKRLLRSLSLNNLLSFGFKGVKVDLQPLNVLIGPNGSGKSNFIEAIRLLQSTPNDLTVPIYEGGGISEWLNKNTKFYDNAHVSATFNNGSDFAEDPFAYENDRIVRLIHTLSVSCDAQRQRMKLTHENITTTVTNESTLSEDILYEYRNGQAKIKVEVQKQQEDGRLAWVAEMRTLDDKNFKLNQSIISQRYDPEQYFAISQLAYLYTNIKVYSDFAVGRSSSIRFPSNPDGIENSLLEDGSNLAIVLNDLDSRPGVMKRIVDKMKLFNERIVDVKTRYLGGTIQILVEEEGLQATIPAMRLSDGTLRFLCLLTVLLHPEPPPLICIEEPELGMHPDAIRTIAELLKEAATRTQIIITTHSDLLVSDLSDVPECLIVCERSADGTTMRHLDPGELEGFDENTSLGEIWLKGAIGGTRW